MIEKQHGRRDPQEDWGALQEMEVEKELQVKELCVVLQGWICPR